MLPLVCLILAIACSSSDNPLLVPAENQIAQIEVLLSKEHCIGDLHRWERRYQYLQDMSVKSATTGEVFTDTIVFRLRLGNGGYPIKPSLRRLSAKRGFLGEIDDRPGGSAFGRFDVKSGKLAFEGCGFSEGG